MKGFSRTAAALYPFRRPDRNSKCNDVSRTIHGRTMDGGERERERAKAKSEFEKWGMSAHASIDPKGEDDDTQNILGWLSTLALYSARFSIGKRKM